MAQSVVIELADLWTQARACTPTTFGPPGTVAAVASPGSPIVRLVLLGSVGLLALGAALPGSSVFGPWSSPAVAAPVDGQVVEEAVVTRGPGLPATGSAHATPGAADARRGTPVTAAGGTSACTAPCSTSQVVSVTIRPGPLEVTAAPTSVTVTTDGDGVGVARLSGMRVTDLRGAGEGWTLSTRVVSVTDARSGAAVPAATVEVTPTCERTAGPLTLESADRSVVPVGGAASLCIVPIASQGSLAGGLVSAYADIVLRGAPAGTELRVLVGTSLA